jgi:hypothetical protein
MFKIGDKVRFIDNPVNRRTDHTFFSNTYTVKEVVDDHIIIELGIYHHSRYELANKFDVKVGDWVELTNHKHVAVEYVFPEHQSFQAGNNNYRMEDGSAVASMGNKLLVVRIVPPSEVPVTITLTGRVEPYTDCPEYYFWLTPDGVGSQALRFDMLSPADADKVKAILKAQAGK